MLISGHWSVIGMGVVDGPLAGLLCRLPRRGGLPVRTFGFLSCHTLSRPLPLKRVDLPYPPPYLLPIVQRDARAPGEFGGPLVYPAGATTQVSTQR
jgi:hypothetical protein